MRPGAVRAFAGAGMGAAVVAGGLLLMRAIQDHLIFFPQARLDATPSVLGLPFEDVALTTADGETLAAWYVAPKQPSVGTVLFLHGNAGNRSHRLHAVEGFVGEGFSILIFDYRGFGGSSGSPTSPGLTLDADAAWAYLTQERRVEAGAIVLYAESIGSVPALRLARRLATEGSPGPAALVMEGGFTTGLEMGKKAFWFLPVSWLLSDPMDNLAAISEVRVPTFFLHGTDDEVVPFEMGRRLYDASGARVKTFRAVDGARHNSVWMVGARALYAEIAAFIRRSVETPPRG